MKSSQQIERYIKGAANHYRIEMLLVLSKNEPMTFEEIVTKLRGNAKTLGEHTRRLLQAGLIRKKYRGRYVDHTLSPYGKKIVEFIKLIQKLD